SLAAGTFAVNATIGQPRPSTVRRSLLIFSSRNSGVGSSSRDQPGSNGVTPSPDGACAPLAYVLLARARFAQCICRDESSKPTASISFQPATDGESRSR